MTESESRDRKPIDQNSVRRARQPAQRALHRQVRGPQNVEPVDLRHRGQRKRDHDARVGAQFGINLLAFFWRKLFRVVQNGVKESIREDDGRGKDRTGQRTAPRFIDPSHHTGAGRAHLVFKFKRAGHDDLGVC